MKQSIALFFLLLFVQACDSPTGTSPDQQLFEYSGKVQAYRDCATIVNLDGFKVEVLGTNVFAFTDSAGNFRLASLTSGSHWMRVSKEGYWPYTTNIDVYSTDARPEGGYAFLSGKSALYEVKFMGEWLSQVAERTVSVDSFYTNSYGELVRTAAYRKVTDTSYSIMTEVWYNGEKFSPAYPTVVAYQDASSEWVNGDPALYYSETGLSSYYLRSKGVETGDTIYVQAAVQNTCQNGQGFVRSEIAKTIFLMP
jgi:hypothetical protein